MERRDLYQDDLTEERQPTPAMRDDVARTQTLDPDAPGSGARASTGDDDADDDDLEDDDEDLDDDEDAESE